jgi:hypothetical protein
MRIGGGSGMLEVSGARVVEKHEGAGMPPSERMVDGPPQVTQIDWLEQVAECAALHARSCTGRVIHCSQHQDSDAGFQLWDRPGQVTAREA